MREDQAREIVYERSGRVCEVCGCARATEYQHRQNRSQGGDWSPSNALHCCHRCHHVRIHGQPTQAIERGWTVPRGVTPVTVPVLYRGELVWLDDLGSVEPDAWRRGRN